MQFLRQKCWFNKLVQPPNLSQLYVVSSQMLRNIFFPHVRWKLPPEFQTLKQGQPPCGPLAPSFIPYYEQWNEECSNEDSY